MTKARRIGQLRLLKTPRHTTFGLRFGGKAVPQIDISRPERGVPRTGGSINLSLSILRRSAIYLNYIVVSRPRGRLLSLF
jgi:hypothetical protein